MIDCIQITVFNGMNHAVFKMLLDDVLADLVQFALDGSQLNQHVGTVVIVFDHRLYLVQVADGP